MEVKRIRQKKITEVFIARSALRMNEQFPLFIARISILLHRPFSSPIGTFKSTTKAGITTINPEGDVSVKPQSSHVAIFEGFFDVLSWQVMQSTMKPSCDVVVLNSVTNLEKARAYITAHRNAVCFLDNDDAGRKCMEAVKRMMHGKEVTDMSDLYGSYKDLNEMLQKARGYSSNMRLSNGI